MPFTPIHMGPGILIKSILQGSFSLMVFGWAQIIMDTQPLVVMLTGEGQVMLIICSPGCGAERLSSRITCFLSFHLLILSVLLIS